MFISTERSNSVETTALSKGGANAMADLVHLIKGSN